MTVDTTVIGSGISGLATTCLLAREGKNCLVLEQASAKSPLIRSFPRDGVYCEPGFHYTAALEKGQLFQVLLSMIGIEDQIELIAMPDQHFDFIEFEQQLVPVPRGLSAFQECLFKLFPESREAVKALITYFQKIFHDILCLKSKQLWQEDAFFFLTNPTTADFLREKGGSPRLISFLSRHSFSLFGSGLEECSLFIYSLAMAGFYESACGVRGGGMTLANAFASQADKLGVKILCRKKVIKIAKKDEKSPFLLQTADGDCFQSENCVFTGHPHLLIDILEKGSVKPAFLNKLRGMENSLSGFAFFYDYKQLPGYLESSNHYLFKEDKKESLSLLTVHGQSRGQEKRALVALLLNPEEGPLFQGASLSAGREYQQIKSQAALRAEKQIYQLYPELKGQLKQLCSCSPKSYQDYTLSPQGSFFGLKKKAGTAYLSARTPLPGLYLAGQSLRAGLLGALTSSFHAAAQLLGEEKLIEKLKSFC